MTLETNPSNLNVKKIDTEFDIDPLFRKVASRAIGSDERHLLHSTREGPAVYSSTILQSTAAGVCSSTRWIRWLLTITMPPSLARDLSWTCGVRSKKLWCENRGFIAGAIKDSLISSRFFSYQQRVAPTCKTLEREGCVLSKCDSH